MGSHRYTRFRHKCKTLSSNNRNKNNNHSNVIEGQTESLPPANPGHIERVTLAIIGFVTVYIGRGLDGLELAERLTAIIPMWATVPGAGIITALVCVAFFIGASYGTIVISKVLRWLASTAKQRVTDFHQWATQSYHRLRGR